METHTVLCLGCRGDSPLMYCELQHSGCVERHLSRFRLGPGLWQTWFSEIAAEHPGLYFHLVAMQKKKQ